MDELIISDDNNKIIIIVNKKNWSDIYIEQNKERIRIGAQRLEVFVYNFMLSFINLEQRKYFEYANMQLFSVVNLMDSHSVIAGRYVNNELELYHLETDGKVNYLFSLNENQRIGFIKNFCDKIVL